MNWGVHRVGADGALEQLVDAGGGDDPGGRRSASVGLRGVVVKGGRLLIYPVDRRHAFDAIRLHASGGEVFRSSHLTCPLFVLELERGKTKRKGAACKE